MCGEQPTASSKSSLDEASEGEEGSSKEEEQRNDKESETLLKFLNCAWLWDTLTSPWLSGEHHVTGTWGSLPWKRLE